jgi:hypothetical protein
MHSRIADLIYNTIQLYREFVRGTGIQPLSSCNGELMNAVVQASSMHALMSLRIQYVLESHEYTSNTDARLVDNRGSAAVE